MFKKFMLLTLSLAIALFISDLYAQTAVKPQTSTKTQTTTKQNIIIQKKDSVKEKITVVIDGNNVTVNGKPIDDFVSADVDIIQQKIKDGNFYVYSDGAIPPMAPLPPQADVLKKDIMRIQSNQAFLGVMTEQNSQGAKITDVTEGSAAEKAGLKEGDIITKIGDDKIAGPDDLYKVVGKRKPEEKVAITYLRDGKQATANASLGKSDQMRVYSWNTPHGDVLRRNYAPGNFSFSWNDDKPRLGVSAQDTEDGKGVKVLDIDDDDSPAAKAGLKEDDIITQVNGKAIASTDDLIESMKDIKKATLLR